MPILEPVAIQNSNDTFSWCRIELNDQNEVEFVYIAPETDERMMPALDQYTIRFDADFPSPLRVLDPNDSSGMKPYCLVIENKQLYRFHSNTHRTIGERVLESSKIESLKGAVRKKMIQLHNIDTHEATLHHTPALDEIKSALLHQVNEKNQLHVDFLTFDMPQNTRPLNAHQRLALSTSEFYHNWLALKRASSSQADYCSRLWAVLNNQDDGNEETRFLRTTLWAERINLLPAFYDSETRPVEYQPRLGDVHAWMVHLLVQELGFYSLKPFDGVKPKLPLLQYDFRVGDYSTANANALTDAYHLDIISKTDCIDDALNNPNTRDDQGSLEYKFKLISGIKNSLLDDCASLKIPFQNYKNACIINLLTNQRGVSRDALFDQLDTLQQTLTVELNTLFNQHVAEIKANHPNKTVWHTLEAEMGPKLLMSADLGSLILAQLNRLDEASQSRLPSSYWGTPAKVEAAVRALHATLSEVPESQDPTPYLYRSLFNKADGSLYHAFSSHRLPFFTKAGEPTRAILNMSLAYAKQRLEHLTGTPVGDSLLHEIDRLESATHHYWPWCYKAQKKLDGILDAIIHLQPDVKDIAEGVLVNAIQQDSELKTALNVHRFFQSTAPTHTLKTIQDAIGPQLA